MDVGPTVAAARVEANRQLSVTYAPQFHSARQQFVDMVRAAGTVATSKHDGSWFPSDTRGSEPSCLSPSLHIAQDLS